MKIAATGISTESGEDRLWYFATPNRKSKKQGAPMRYRWLGVAGAALLAAGSTAYAHHSFAMFDQANQVDLEGVVQEFRYVAPHTFILLEVKPKDGDAATWMLEGASPSALERGGWSKASLKTGDAIKVHVAPLRSGAPGGSWVPEKIQFLDGKPIVAGQHALAGGQ
jgi:hypothetical protein